MPARFWPRSCRPAAWLRSFPSRSWLPQTSGHSSAASRGRLASPRGGKGQGRGHRKSVSFRKVYVEEYSVGARSGYCGKCLVTIRGLFDELETACGEQFSNRSAELLAVVSN